MADVAVGAEMWCLSLFGGESSCTLLDFGFDHWGIGHYEPVRRSRVSYTELSAGDFHICGLTDDGTIFCWGHNGAGQTNVPAGEFTAVDSGQWHSCAIDLDGALECWGGNSHGQSLSPEGRFKRVAPGGRHTCAITAVDELQCWGDNAQKQSQPPSGKWSAVSSGEEHSCAISMDQALACWGSNAHGQIEIPGGKWVQVDVGALEDWGTEFCALREDGMVACANNLATYEVLWRSVSARPPDAPSGRWRAIDLGSNQRCLQDERMQVQCWRWHEQRGRVVSYLAPIPYREGGYPKFGAGGVYVCLIDEQQRLRCVRSSGTWSNDFANSLNPQPVTTWSGRFTDLAVGYRHVCALRVDGQITCLQLDNVTDQSLLPDLPPLPDLSEPVVELILDTNESWSCASGGDPECPDPPGCLLAQSGRALCWGRGSGDQWSVGTEPGFTAIGVGCGIDAAGAIDCWDGTEALLSQGAGPYVSLGSSAFSHCAITAGGDIHCWGEIGIAIRERENSSGACSRFPE